MPATTPPAGSPPGADPAVEAAAPPSTLSAVASSSLRGAGPLLSTDADGAALASGSALRRARLARPLPPPPPDTCACTQSSAPRGGGCRSVSTTAAVFERRGGRRLGGRGRGNGSAGLKQRGRQTSQCRRARQQLLGAGLPLPYASSSARCPTHRRCFVALHPPVLLGHARIMSSGPRTRTLAHPSGSSSTLQGQRGAEQGKAGGVRQAMASRRQLAQPGGLRLGTTPCAVQSSLDPNLSPQTAGPMAAHLTTSTAQPPADAQASPQSLLSPSRASSSTSGSKVHTYSSTADTGGAAGFG